MKDRESTKLYRQQLRDIVKLLDKVKKKEQPSIARVMSYTVPCYGTKPEEWNK